MSGVSESKLPVAKFKLPVANSKFYRLVIDLSFRSLNWIKRLSGGCLNSPTFEPNYFVFNGNCKKSG